MLADGASITPITQTVGIRRRFVYKWAERYRKQGLTGLADKAGRGRKLFFPSGGSDASGQEGVRAA
jgi:transposase